MIYKKDTIDMSLVQCGYEEEQGYIYISDEYTNNILTLSGHSDISEDDYISICASGKFTSFPYYYSTNSYRNAYHYALWVLKGRFELGEPIIATDSIYSYRYARDALKGRFELGEPVIATSALYSYYYAHDVIKGRFELGEATIAEDGDYKQKYFELTGIQL